MQNYCVECKVKDHVTFPSYFQKGYLRPARIKVLLRFSVHLLVEFEAVVYASDIHNSQHDEAVIYNQGPLIASCDLFCTLTFLTMTKINVSLVTQLMLEGQFLPVQL